MNAVLDGLSGSWEEFDDSNQEGAGGYIKNPYQKKSKNDSAKKKWKRDAQMRHRRKHRDDYAW